VTRPVFVREALMVAAAIASYFTSPKSIHAANDFNFRPIQEVAVLFAGIFATMMPALDWLDQNAGGWLGQNPAPGSCSGVRVRCPACLTTRRPMSVFSNALFGAMGTKDVAELLNQHALNLLAVSVGAVFFGAATYIGNGPNFMVKAVADQQKIRTPTFPGFVLKFTLPFLLPMLLAIWLIFFRAEPVAGLKHFLCARRLFSREYACQELGLRVRKLYNILFTIFFVLSSPYYFMRIVAAWQLAPGFREPLWTLQRGPQTSAHQPPYCLDSRRQCRRSQFMHATHPCARTSSAQRQNCGVHHDDNRHG